MATVLEFSSPAGEFPLGTVFETLPEVTVELERLVPHGSMIIPYFWVRGAEAEDIEATFESHAGVVSVDLIDSVEDEYLMRAEWEREYFGVLSALSEANVALLSGVGTRHGWQFEVRGEDREAVSELRAVCQDHDIRIEITAVHSLLPVTGDDYELTDRQREALVTAYEHGYFDSPRAVTLEAVAAAIGITQQSLSSRLRRGHHRLISKTLIRSREQ
jgi:predicted DNA binding protein